MTNLTINLDDCISLGAFEAAIDARDNTRQGESVFVAVVKAIHSTMKNEGKPIALKTAVVFARSILGREA